MTTSAAVAQNESNERMRMRILRCHCYVLEIKYVAFQPRRTIETERTKAKEAHAFTHSPASTIIVQHQIEIKSST